MGQDLFAVNIEDSYKSILQIGNNNAGFADNTWYVICVGDGKDSGVSISTVGLKVNALTIAALDGYLKSIAGLVSSVSEIDPTDIGPGTANISILGSSVHALSAAGLDSTLPVSGGGTGETTLAANGVLIGNDAGAITTVAPVVAGRMLTSSGTGAAPTYGAAVRTSSPTPFSAARPSAKISGTTLYKLVGNPRTSEFMTVAPGFVGYGQSDWNPTQDANMPCHICKLANGMLVLAYVRQNQEAAADGAARLCIRTSNNLGVDWTAETIMLTGSYFTSVAALADCSCMQDSRGRLFLTFNVRPLNDPSLNWGTWYIWTDDPFAATGWSVPSNSIRDPNFDSQNLMVNTLLELPDKTLLCFPNGLTGSAAYRSVSCMQSTDHGITWSRRALVADGPSASKSFIECGSAFRPDGTILLAIRNNDDLTTVFYTSSDLGFTYTGPGAQALNGAGKPTLCTLTNGTILLLDRTINSTAEICMYVCRDGSGMNATSWGSENDFDPTHLPMKYGAFAEIAPNLVVCAFSHLRGYDGTTNFAEIMVTYFSDGAAIFPNGCAAFRNVECNDLAPHRQVIPTIGKPAPVIPYPASNSGSDLNTTINSILDGLVAGGYFTQNPNMMGSLCYWGEPWQLPATINDWTCNFTSDTTARRTSGQTIASTTLSGVWAASSGLTLSATTGKVGPEFEIVWDFGRGDGTLDVTCAALNTNFWTIYRVTDANNFLVTYIDGSTVKIYKCVAGTLTSLLSNALTITAGHSVVSRTVLSGNSINIYVNDNGAGFPSTPNATYTLTGSDATAFPNTLTKVGIAAGGISTNVFSSLVFHTPLIYGNLTTVGDFVGELPDLTRSGGIGSLVNTTLATGRQVALGTHPNLFRGRPFLWQGAAPAGSTFLQSAAFSAKTGPFTLFWAGFLPGETANQRAICFATGSHFPGISLTNARVIQAKSSSAINAPAFSTYSQGPTILRAEFDYPATTARLYRDGVLVASGTTGTLGTITQFCLGDTGNIRAALDYHVSLFNAILTPQQALEHERMIADGGMFEAWNPR